jgi:MFS family permease
MGNGLAAVPHPAAVAIGRFISGFAGGIPPAISPGAIEDILEDPTARTRALFAWASASNVGLAGGPILSSILANRLGWSVNQLIGKQQ